MISRVASLSSLQRSLPPVQSSAVAGFRGTVLNKKGFIWMELCGKAESSLDCHFCNLPETTALPHHLQRNSLYMFSLPHSLSPQPTGCWAWPYLLGEKWIAVISKEKKERDRMDKSIEDWRDITTSGFCNGSWLLQSQCPWFEVMITVLICCGWGKHMKHKGQWVNIWFRFSWKHPGTSPGGVKFTLSDATM